MKNIIIESEILMLRFERRLDTSEKKIKKITRCSTDNVNEILKNMKDRVISNIHVLRVLEGKGDH